ncbi:MAG: Hpt domain-containing protein [Betaproteobacteria bacterium]|nr:Hpt domain-containing protein [Betaproteobacteria bacterium]
MPLEPIVVTIDRNLEDLVPVYMAQRRADQAILAAALPAHDFAAIRRMAHAIVGASASYGFDELGQLGERIGMAARVADVAVLVRLKAEFDDYLSRLSVKDTLIK